ncbi:MAG: 3,4-dehydroadipyl-CoA semialdehyde dehydrogenase [Gammaproteobacteria bacterium]|nr:3,4-dehydroadipyl-CoA semialdehyde dehydrogenase [Gammaproteobacteria bacterium]
MIDKLQNYVSGNWVLGSGLGTVLTDPILGSELVTVDSYNLDIPEAFEFARQRVKPELGSHSFMQRAEMLSQAVKVLQANRDKYFDIATKNSATVKTDSAIDIDGGIYTLNYYAKLSLTNKQYLLDGETTKIGKEYYAKHILTPIDGVALCINAFNFPSWGLWEKVAPAILSGVPVIVKPATVTAWLTHAMLKDVMDAKVLPAGAISLICGSPDGLIEQLRPNDVLSFTGSAETAIQIKSHPNINRSFIRCNLETDSINSALLLPDEFSNDVCLQALCTEVVREMTVKSGQKCTAIRRVLVPANRFEEVVSLIQSQLKKVNVGNPRHDSVTMGGLVSLKQKKYVLEGVDFLCSHARVLFDGRDHRYIDVPGANSSCLGPILLGLPEGKIALEEDAIHQTEVFGPVSTIIAYDNLIQAYQMIKRGQGSLVVSLYGDNIHQLQATALTLANCHGKVHIVSPHCVSTHTGHGNVMPQSIHGGPGRAGGGQELGAERALQFYHQKSVIQAHGTVLEWFQ